MQVTISDTALAEVTRRGGVAALDFIAPIG